MLNAAQQAGGWDDPAVLQRHYSPHVIADAGWELPTTAREHFDVLARHHVIDAETAQQLRPRA
jgi:hypothetical protein